MSIQNSLTDLDLAASGLQLILAYGTKQDGSANLVRAELTDAVAEDFKGIVFDIAAGVLKPVSTGDARIRNYDASVAQIDRDFEVFDADEYDPITAQLAALDDVWQIAIFDGSDEVIDHLRFYSITMIRPDKPRIHFLRQFGSKNELHRSRFFGLKFSKGTYDRVEEKTFLFDEKVDCIACENDILIIRKNSFHQMFRFYEAVKTKGQESLGSLQQLALIANFADFQQSCEGHAQKLAKLNSIVRKGYMGAITIADIKRVRDKLGLPVEIVEVEGVEQLLHDAKDRWMILKLLDDDYFMSDMTGRKYEASSKRDMAP